MYSRSSSGHGPLPRSAPRRALRPEHVSPRGGTGAYQLSHPQPACHGRGWHSPGRLRLLQTTYAVPTCPRSLEPSRGLHFPSSAQDVLGQKFISFRPVHVRVQGDPRQLGRGPKGSAPCTPHKRALGPGGAASVTCSSRSRSNFRQLQRSPTRASGSAMSTSTNVGPPLPSLPPTGSNPTHSRVSRPGYIRTLHFGPVPGVGPS